MVPVLALLLALACGAAGGAENSIRLSDVTAETGIAFRHTDGGSGRRYIVETVAAGLALLDYDGDGLIDIYFLNGTPLQGTTDASPGNALYRNQGGFRFTDVTAPAAVGRGGYGLAVAAADYDNDGDLDIYLSNFGPNKFFRNNGDGTFTDITLETGTAAGGDDKVGAGACFLDVDGDGDLDLYVANYLSFTYQTHVHNTWMGFHVYPGPDHYQPVQHMLYRNNGDGSFTDISAASGIGAHLGRGMGAICADYDADGDTDILVANDSMPSFLFENDGAGKFEEVGLLTGFACDMHGAPQGSMGVECADLDNDGLLDFYKTSYQDQWATFYRNLDGKLLEDVTLQTGAGTGTLPHVTWGIGVVDFDNDGDRDIFVARGHLYDNVDQFSDTSSYEVANLLLMNTGSGRFVDVSGASGDALAVVRSSRGAAFDDLDNDGDVDGVVLNSRQQPTVMRNDTPQGHHWLQLRLIGTRRNRDGVGARVTVTAGDLVLIDEVHSGRSYQSHFGARLHFGLGKRAHVDRVEIRWMGGQVQALRDVAVDRLFTVIEDAGLR